MVCQDFITWNEFAMLGITAIFVVGLSLLVFLYLEGWFSR